jgi:selT/selW/selH-like putative selenoprotein
LAAELEKRFGAKVKLVEGARGAFEVSVDGRLVFSKTETRRFPENDEIFAHFS